MVDRVGQLTAFDGVQVLAEHVDRLFHLARVPAGPATTAVRGGQQFRGQHGQGQLASPPADWVRTQLPQAIHRPASGAPGVDRRFA